MVNLSKLDIPPLDILGTNEMVNGVASTIGYYWCMSKQMCLYSGLQ